MQNSGAITTAISEVQGRLKVGVGCPHGKKKCLKCAMKKKDGKGGPGVLDAPGYGATAMQTSVPSKVASTTNKAHRSTKGVVGLKMKGIKGIMSTIKALSKKMKFKKVVKNQTKSKKLKYALRGII